MASILNILNTPEPDDCSNGRLVRDSAIEFMATTVFVYFGTMSAVSTGSMLNIDQGDAADVARILPIAVCFGVSILALAHSIGHLTGGHMNPGVSFLMFLRRQISAVKMASYIVCQLIGALLASALVWGSSSGLQGTSAVGGSISIDKPPFTLGSTTLNPNLTTGNGFLLELMGSFFFYFVIAQTALDKRGIATTAFPAIPIGLILVVVHVCLIPFTGCGVNPARTFGPSMVTCMADSDMCSDVAGDWYWIYFVGPFLAAFLVAEVTLLMDSAEDAAAAEEVKELDDEES